MVFYYKKIYDRGILGKLTKMTINFNKSSGSTITSSLNNIIDYDIMTPKDECICKYDKMTGKKIRDYKCYHSYLRHPGYEKLQNTLLFKIGVLESNQIIQNI